MLRNQECDLTFRSPFGRDLVDAINHGELWRNVEKCGALWIYYGAL